MTLSYVEVLELAMCFENNSLYELLFKCDSKVCNTKYEGVFFIILLQRLQKAVK